MEPERKVSSVASTLPSLRRKVGGSVESETGAIGLGLELAFPFKEVEVLADESHVTNPLRQSEVRTARS